jgi:hypothetical protein
LVQVFCSRPDFCFCRLSDFTCCSIQLPVLVFRLLRFAPDFTRDSSSARGQVFAPGGEFLPAAVFAFAVLPPPVWLWSQHAPRSGFPFLLRAHQLGSSLDLRFWRWLQVPHFPFRAAAHLLANIIIVILGSAFWSCLQSKPPVILSSSGSVPVLSLRSGISQFVFLYCRQIQVLFSFSALASLLLLRDLLFQLENFSSRVRYRSAAASSVLATDFHCPRLSPAQGQQSTLPNPVVHSPRFLSGKEECWPRFFWLFRCRSGKALVFF